MTRFLSVPCIKPSTACALKRNCPHLFSVLFALFFFSCGRSSKNDQQTTDQAAQVRVVKAGTYQVPADSLQPLKPLPAGQPTVTPAKTPSLVPANLNVHPLPAKVPVYDLALLPVPSRITPGASDTFSLPETKKAITHTIPAGIPEVVQVKDAYTKDLNPGNFSAFIKLQGLKHGNVNCILQDRRGNLWIGTDGGGATCYDGKYFTHFTDAAGLPNNVVRAMLQDSKGRIWYATDAGMACYDGHTFTRFTIESDALNSSVMRSVVEDQQGNIWFGSDGGGAIRYDGKNLTYFTEENGLLSNSVYILLPDSKGNLWIGTPNGLSTYDGKTFTHYNAASGIPCTGARALFEDRSGRIWIGTDQNGVFCYNGKTFTQYTTNEGLSWNSVCSIMQDKSGQLWIGTEGGGISRFDGKNFTHFSEKQGLTGSTVLCGFEDAGNNIWFGIYGGGIARYDGKLFTHMTENEGLSSNVVRSILQDRKGNLWFGTNGGGACRYDGRTFAWFGEAQGMAHVVVRSMIEDRKGNLWFGTHGGGVCRYDGNSFAKYTTDQGLTHNVVRCMYEDRQGQIWLGTYGGGAVRFDGEHFTAFTTREGMSHNTILCIMEDSKGNMWFGTEGGGLTCYDGNHFAHFTEKQGLCNNEVWSMLEDAKGNLWMATGGGGVAFYNGKSFASFTSREGLSNNFVFSVLQDQKENLWFGTRFGLNKLTRENRWRLEKIIKGDPGEMYNKGQVYFKSYTYEDGFLGIGCFGNSILEDRDGTIWVGTNDRLTAYHPDGDEPDTIAPQIHLNGIDLFNENIAWPALSDGKNEKDTSVVLGNSVEVSHFNFDGLSSWYRLPQQLSLAYTNNYLTFRFIGVTLKQSAKVKYQYKLDGLEENWSALVNRTEAPYGNLSPGEYTFRVRAMNSEGHWSKEFKYTFTIRPPWWKTIWFRIILGTLGVLLLYGIYYWRTASMRTQQRKLEQTVVSRTAELVLQKEEAEKQRKNAEQQKELVEKKQREITDSITYAKHIQEAILPPESLVKKWLPQSFILYKPKDIVAGDFYFFEVTETHLFYAAADCTGHGVPGALVSVVCSNALTRCVKEFGLTQPGQILDKARQLVIETFEKSGQDVKDGMDISLISFAFDNLKFEIRAEEEEAQKDEVPNFSVTNTHFEFQWAGANNPLWIVGQDGSITEVDPDKQAIGKTDRPRPFNTHKLSLAPGSSLFLFTDGYADQFGGADGKKLKYKKLKEFLREAAAMKNGRQAAYLNAKFDEWRGQREQVDDVCIIGIKL